MAQGNLGRGAGVAAVFAFGGPVIGTALVFLVMVGASLLAAPSEALMTVFLLPFAVVIGLMTGFPPAAATGVLMALASPHLARTWLWVAACGVCGLVTTFGVLRLASMEEFIISAAGMGAATACALITRRWRPR